MLLYSGYIAMFIYPYTFTFYTASVLVGIGAAGKEMQPKDLVQLRNTSSMFILVFCVVVLWTAQGYVLAINSTDHTIGRNSGIFWALLQFR